MGEDRSSHLLRLRASCEYAAFLAARGRHGEAAKLLARALESLPAGADTPERDAARAWLARVASGTRTEDRE
jgi:hypothetical protein